MSAPRVASGALTHGLRVASSARENQTETAKGSEKRGNGRGTERREPRHARLLKSRLRMSPGAHVNMTPIHIVSPKQMPQKCAGNRKQQPDAETD